MKTEAVRSPHAGILATPKPSEQPVTLTFEVARLRAPEAGGQLLQSLRQRGHHVAKEPLLLLGAGPARPAGQSLHGPLAPVEELGGQAHGSQRAGKGPRAPAPPHARPRDDNRSARAHGPRERGPDQSCRRPHLHPQKDPAGRERTRAPLLTRRHVLPRCCDLLT